MKTTLICMLVLVTLVMNVGESSAMEARVIRSGGQTAELRYDGEPPSPGDAVMVYLPLAGIGVASVAKGTVESCSGDHVRVRIASATGTIRPGYRARITTVATPVVSPPEAGGVTTTTHLPPAPPEVDAAPQFEFPTPYPRRNRQAAWSRTDRGRFRLFRGHSDQAEIEFREAARHDDSYGDAWVGLATALSRQGRDAEAVICAEKAYDLGERDAAILKILGKD